MSLTKTNILNFLFLFLFVILQSQQIKDESLRGSFTYLLKSKPNNLDPDKIYEELFSLQVSDTRAFFISESMLKFDSAFRAETKIAGNIIDNRGKTFPKIKSQFVIVQSNQDIEYFRKVGMTLLSYKTPIINNWALINENQMINSINCKKAEVNYKGRTWIAWYATEIVLPYGPYNFSGLPGLIVKITDKKGDYDFELIRSVATNDLKGKTLTINKNYYENSRLVSKAELTKARENFDKNILGSMDSMGVIVSPELRKDMIQRQKNKELDKKGYNPIELED